MNEEIVNKLIEQLNSSLKDISNPTVINFKKYVTIFTILPNVSKGVNTLFESEQSSTRHYLQTDNH